MAYTATHADLSAPREGFFTKLGRAFVQAMENQHDLPRRRQEIIKLNNMSDAELAQRGISREGIARHVFRDMMYV
ncbi:DUF1127 domain-containing protein [Marivivens aquimaris]|uniref:DUF1127 domain-containing protein n=1 Tax=Marivivens aquimaris TaxID=2774876 RepID=UPI00187EBFAE|nr:DUF1127 domain-containing protein [Marivivens aquimaris]